MANDNTFDPSQDIGRQDNRQLGNLAVSSPFEPGSVNKIITAASVIEFGLSNPDEVLQVPGSIHMGGVTVGDAWEHGVMPYTTTGVFGKSSNVGTLMLAQRIGPERYAEMVRKFGLGQRTGVGLPGESAGLVPPIDQWSGSTFSNLPIGQGLSMTLLQMTGMYQTIANDGVRIPPRIVKATIAPDGTRTDEPRPEGVRVVSPQTAQTVRQMLRATAATRSHGHTAGHRIAGRRRGLPDLRQDGHRTADQPGLWLLLQRRLLDHVRRHRHDRQPALRRRRDDGQPAPHCRWPARDDGGPAVPQHRVLVAAAGERAAFPRGPAADAAGGLSDWPTAC